MQKCHFDVYFQKSPYLLNMEGLHPPGLHPPLKNPGYATDHHLKYILRQTRLGFIFSISRLASKVSLPSSKYHHAQHKHLQ